jgi:anti-sigma factor RsiW
MRANAHSPRVSGGLSRSCEIAGWRLILPRENELPKAEAAALRRHLRGCARCRESHRLLDALFAVLRDQPIPEPDDPCWEKMAERIMARIRAIPACPGPIDEK